MKEPKLEVIHSAALNVTTNAQHQVFESMDEPTLVILRIFCNSMWNIWEKHIQMAQQYL